MADIFSGKARAAAKWTERILSFFILIGIAIFICHSAILLWQMDWGNTETFYDLIDRTLLIVIGIELMRTLISHDLHVILELLAIVIARKLLKPGVDNMDIIISVTAFCGLLAGRKFLLEPEEKDKI